MLVEIKCYRCGTDVVWETGDGPHYCGQCQCDMRNEAQGKNELSPAHGSAAWIYCDDRLPPPDTDVETKIDDGRGVRNVCQLRRHNNLWWFTSMSMYIYYSPTHWRPLPPNVPDQRP